MALYVKGVWRFNLFSRTQQHIICLACASKHQIRCKSRKAHEEKKSFFEKYIDDKKSATLEEMSKHGTEFEPIYKCDYIAMLASASKLKIYQGVALFLAVPVSFVLYSNGTISEDGLFFVTVGGLMITLQLTLLSAVLNRFIGFIYVNNDKTEVKISYLDFHGQRVDAIFHRDSFLPIRSDLNPIRDKLYSIVRMYKGDERFKISLPRGTFIDIETFEDIFGEIPTKVLQQKT